MPVISGKPKTKIAITIGHENLKKIQGFLERGEFSSVSEIIEKGMTFYFENRNRQLFYQDPPNFDNKIPDSPQEQFKAWIKSDEGKEYMTDIFRKMKGE